MNSCTWVRCCGGKVDRRRVSLYLPLAKARPSKPFRFADRRASLGKRHPLLHVARARESNRRGWLRDDPERAERSAHGGFTQHVPSAPGQTWPARVRAFASRHHRARRHHRRHADERRCAMRLRLRGKRRAPKAGTRSRLRRRSRSHGQDQWRRRAAAGPAAGLSGCA